jgi:hypothetical protein
MLNAIFINNRIIEVSESSKEFTIFVDINIDFA